MSVRFRRVLVTGGAGFLGSGFVRHLLGVDPDVRVVTLDALTYAGRVENLASLPDPARHSFVRGDVRDEPLVLGLLRDGADAIVHFAAETHVDRSILGPAPFVETNVVGTFALLEAARRVWLDERALAPDACRFHQISTDEVYGSLGPGDAPAGEGARYAPGSPYAASKAAGDHLVRAYSRTYGLPVTITHACNAYGPRQYPEKLVPLMVLGALRGRDLPVYGDGLHVRDWLYVDDHSEATLRVLADGRAGESYNLCAGEQVANLDLVRAICRGIDRLRPTPDGRSRESRIAFVADRPGHDRRYAMDGARMRREFGWRPRVPLATGLERTVEWYLDNPRWIESASREDYAAWIERNYGARGAPAR